MSKSRGYQLLDSGRVVKAIESHSTIVERPNEAQARELAPLAKADPQAAAGVWEKSVRDAHDRGERVSAKSIREMYAEHGTLPNEVQAVSINRFRIAEYSVRYSDGSNGPTSRQYLLSLDGWKKCSCCSGYGVIASPAPEEE